MSGLSTHLLLILALCASGASAEEPGAGAPEALNAPAEDSGVSEEVLSLLEDALDARAPLPEEVPSLPDAKTPAPHGLRPRSKLRPGAPSGPLVPEELITRQIERAPALPNAMFPRVGPSSASPGGTAGTTTAVPTEASTAAARARTETSRRDAPTSTAPSPTPSPSDAPNVPAPDPGRP